MFTGNAIGNNEFEFNNVNEGPLSGKGFVRLMDKQKIKKLYSQFFKIQSIDKIEYTENNGKIMISEYVIVCQKK